MKTMTKTKDVRILTKKEKGKNRHWKNFIDKDYLGSHNLEKGEEMLLTVENFVGEEAVHNSETNQKMPKQVLYFKENVPKMIINITNGDTIASLYGPHPEQWIGKKIQVYVAKVNAFGKMQDALRIRDFIPQREIDVAKYSAELQKATTLEELKNIWVKFPVSVINSPEMVAAKDGFKKLLA